MREFADKIRQHAENVSSRYANCSNEEQTKQSLIQPFLMILGYDIFDPNEVEMEYSSDDPSIKIRNGKPESVDYAVKKDGKIAFFLEAKTAGSELNHYQGQLFRYFVSTVECRHAILTNGTEFRFFTDLDHDNIMDPEPYRTIDMLDLADNDITFMQGFAKKKFSTSTLRQDAERERYSAKIKSAIEAIIDEPTDDFVKMLLGSGVYDGPKTAAVVKRFRPIVKEMLDAAVASKYAVQSKLQRPVAPAATDTADKDGSESSDQPETETADVPVTLENSIEPPFDIFMEYGGKEPKRYFKAQGAYLGDGKVKVLAGSQAAIEDRGTAGPWAMQMRANHLDDDYRFKTDVVFSSPSTAGATVSGAATNGWDAWRTEDGRRLNDVTPRPENKKAEEK